jgi:hypothetical protein
LLYSCRDAFNGTLGGRPASVVNRDIYSCMY